MAKVIMVQGTMSGVGKSLLTAGLCRIFWQDGFCAAPFKSQNMALNSFVTPEGLEIGRAQAMQAEAAKIAPMACMNPILLKPTSHMVSQVIVHGEVIGNMSAKAYFDYKKQLIPEIKKAFRKLEEYADIIVIEGAGSPAEINLKQQDIVNMGMADMVDAPVLLAGDIDRGGVFAQLLGTLMLLEKKERERVKGLIINKFRGDLSILDEGLSMLYQKGKIPVTGVVPYMELSLEDEDSMSSRFEKRERKNTDQEMLDIAVIRYPRISNFTDFNVFEQMDRAQVRYVSEAGELGRPDLIFLPGSKNTISDLKWMRRSGMEEAVKKAAKEIPIFGICGGYQMLGCEIIDEDQMEEGGSIPGMGMLLAVTRLGKEKKLSQNKGVIEKLDGIFAGLSGCGFEGYEIHMGKTFSIDRTKNRIKDGTKDEVEKPEERAVVQGTAPYQNVYGSYLHGLFDRAETANALLMALAEKKGVRLCGEPLEDYPVWKEKQYDKLADTLRECLDMEEIYGMLREAHME